MNKEKLSISKNVEEGVTEDSQHTEVEKFTHDMCQEQIPSSVEESNRRVIEDALSSVEESNRMMMEGVLSSVEESKRMMMEGVLSSVEESKRMMMEGVLSSVKESNRQVIEDALSSVKESNRQVIEDALSSVEESKRMMMEECLTPLEKLSLEYSRDPVGVTQRELTTLTNLGSQENLALDIAVEQRDLTKEMHYSMMQLAELTKRIVDMNEIAANSAEKTTSLTLLIYILTAASIVIGLAGLGIDTATAIIPAESPDLPAVVISIWAGGIIVTIVLTLIMVFCLPKRKKNSKAQLPKSP